MDAGDVVPQLVRHQMVSSVSEKGSPARNSWGLCETATNTSNGPLEIEKRQVVVKVVLHMRAHHRCREQRQDKEQQMEPEARCGDG